MASTFSSNKGYELMATGEDSGTWGIKTNANLTLIDNSFGGRFNKDCSGNSNITVTAPQAENVTHVLTGTLTGNIQYIFPATGAFYWVTNNTTGAFSITLAMTGGTVTRGINQGETVGVFVNPDGNVGVKFLTSSATSRVGPFLINGTGGTANAQTATLAGPASELTTGATAQGILYEFIPSLANTAANPTLAINGQSPLTVASAAVPGALAANQIYLAQANGAGLLNLLASTLKYAGFVLRGTPLAFGASTTYNAAAGTRAVLVLCIGCGGGGGGAGATGPNQQWAASGGAAGGWSLQLFTTGFTGGIAVAVGGLGTGALGAVNGNPGGSVSFGALLTATGGNGGITGPAVGVAAAGITAASVLGGTGSFFGQNTRGGNSGVGMAGTGASNMGGHGGPSILGAGGNNAFGSSNGNPGAVFGAGGSGACNLTSQSTKTGGNGAGGICFVWELL